MKKIAGLICLMLTAAMLFGLAGCGKAKEPSDPNHIVIGDYEVEYKSASIMTDSEEKDALVLTLDFTNNSKETAQYLWCIDYKAVQNGTKLEGAVIFVNDSYDMMADEQLTDVASGETLEVKNAFTLLDTTTPVEVTFQDLAGKHQQTITIDPATLPREERAASETGETETETDADVPAGEEDALLSYWNGDWYGWWVVTGGDGAYEDWSNKWWDCCANINIGADHTGTVEIWDETEPRGDGVSNADVSLNEAGTSEHGTLTSEGGWFLWSELAHADWIVDPGIMDYENLICIDGWYEDEDGSFHYAIYLRPWGTLWDDIKADDPDNLPYSYESWYLPLVEAGKDMPDTIGEGINEDEVNPSGEPEPETSSETSSETSAESTPVQATGKMADKSIDMATFFGDAAATVKFQYPEGIWCVDDRTAYRVEIYNCPDYSDRPYETAWVEIEIKGTREELDNYKDKFENLTDIDGRTIGGVEMAGRMYNYIGIDGIHEYYGQVSTGGWIAVRVYYQEKMDDNTLAELETILSSMTFQ